MELKDEDFEIDKPMQVIETIPPLPFEYDEEDTRIQAIIDQVAAYCGAEFTEVPQNPDEEPGVPVPLAEDATPDEEKKPEPGDPDFVIDPDDPDKTGQIDPDKPGEPYPEQTYELYKLREAYKESLAEYHEERKAYWGRLWQVIRFISSVTCWTDGPFDTFITQVRKQIFEATQECGCRPNCCQCDPDEIVIPLDYTPLDPTQPFIDGWITVFINGEPVKEKISWQYLNDHYDWARGEMHILREDFPDTLLYRGGCCCLCRRKLTITLLYNAGYPTIPPGILAMI